MIVAQLADNSRQILPEICAICCSQHFKVLPTPSIRTTYESVTVPHAEACAMLFARFLQGPQGRRRAVAGARASFPLIGAVGAAVDYSRANSARTAMQAALDSTALMLSKDAQSLDRRAARAARPPPISTRCSTGRRPPTSRSHQQFSSPQQGSFSLKVTGTRDRQHHVLAPDRAAADRTSPPAARSSGASRSSISRSRSTIPARWLRAAR